MKIVSSLWLLVAASSACASASRVTTASPTAIVSSALMVTNTGLSGRGCSGAVLAGRLTPISTVASGAATMKMIRSTRMTSMNGVTLISCWTSRSSPLEPEPSRNAMALLRSPRQRRGRHPVAADHAGKVVVDHDGRDRRDQAERSGEQGFGNAGRHHGEIGGMGFGNTDEGVHDAPDRAEQADKRCGGADGGEDADTARHLPGHRRLHPLQPQGDAFLEAVVDDAVGQF